MYQFIRCHRMMNETHTQREKHCSDADAFTGLTLDTVEFVSNCVLDTRTEAPWAPTIYIVYHELDHKNKTKAHIKRLGGSCWHLKFAAKHDFSTSTSILTGTTVAMAKHWCSLMNKNKNGNATFFYTLYCAGGNDWPISIQNTFTNPSHLTSDLVTGKIHTHKIWFLRLRSRVIGHRVFFCSGVYLEAALFPENGKRKGAWVERCG